MVPDELIQKVIEFQTVDPDFVGEMRMTVTLADTDGGTEVTILREDIPRGIRPEDNETGTHQSLQKLAALLA